MANQEGGGMGHYDPWIYLRSIWICHGRQTRNIPIVFATAMLLRAAALADADTGFLDRSVLIGAARELAGLYDQPLW
jgi:hypothetical protein